MKSAFIALGVYFACRRRRQQRVPPAGARALASTGGPRRPTRGARPPSRRERDHPDERGRRSRPRGTPDGAPRRAPRGAPAAAGGRGADSRPRAVDGRPWLTIAPMIVTPIVAPIWRANCVSAVAEPMRARGTAFCTERTNTCIIEPDPDPGDDHVPRRLAVRRVDVHPPEEQHPDRQHDRPEERRSSGSARSATRAAP